MGGSMKPHWEKLHDWRMSDVRFWLEEIFAFKLLLRKHPDDGVGDSFRIMIKECKKALAFEVSQYEKIYGDKPDVVLLRREVESG